MDKFLKREYLPDCSPSSASVNSINSSSEDSKDFAAKPPAKKKCPERRSKRKYNISYLKFGFTCTGPEHDPKPQCVLCSQVLANASMKPSKLMRHQRTKHSETVTEPIEFFQHKSAQMKQPQQRNIVKTPSANAAALKASFAVALHIAKAKEPHTVAEEHILPSAIDIVTVVLGESMASKMRAIPLSNNSISRRISAMSDDVNEQLVDMLKASKKFAIQLDESTDVGHCSILMVYVRFVNPFSGGIEEEFLLTEELPTRTTEEIFRVLDKFVTENGLDWVNCVGVTTDGAAILTGRHSGLVQQVKNVAPNAVCYNCFIHREALAAKELGEELHEVLTSAVKIVNFIKENSPSSYLFEVLCLEMGSGHESLFLYTQVRWLSRGCVLQRLFELRQEVHIFLLNKKSELANHLVNTDWLAKLVYLVDMFGNLNELNISLQGRNKTIFTHVDKVTAFMRKLKYWGVRVRQGVMDIFPCLTGFLVSLEDKAEETKSNIKPTIIIHLDSLLEKFALYFSTEKSEKFEWVRNPFVIDVTKLSLPVQKEEQLIVLSCDRTLKDKFLEVSLSEFWHHASAEYPELADEAISVLLPFITTHLCDNGFSTMAAMKAKYRSRLCIKHDLRLCLTSITPRIDLLVGGMQAQPSH